MADLKPVRPELVEGLRIGFIGAGRLGTTLALAMQSAGLRGMLGAHMVQSP